MRQYIHNFSSANLGAHPCIITVYTFPLQPTCLPTSPYAILHALLYLAEVVNAYLIDETLSATLETTKNKKAYLRKNANFIAALFSTMQQNAHYPGLEKMIATLGNFLLLFFLYIL